MKFNLIYLVDNALIKLLHAWNINTFFFIFYHHFIFRIKLVYNSTFFYLSIIITFIFKKVKIIFNNKWSQAIFFLV